MKPVLWSALTLVTSVAGVLFLSFDGPFAVNVANAEPQAAAPEAKDSCVACHSDEAFMVTNRKLYDYYQNWQLSVHADAGVTCTDCHGGNPKASSKAEAHSGTAGSATSSASRINFRNVPKTCAGCHEGIYEGYKQSKHFAHLNAKGKSAQGPNCVTCHGSVNAGILHADTVRGVCSKCHNKKTKNHPEVPDRASTMLIRFLAVDRFTHYVTTRGESQEAQTFIKELAPRRAELSQVWHTFDLQQIDVKTRALLDQLKKERELVKSERKGPQK